MSVEKSLILQGIYFCRLIFEKKTTGHRLRPGFSFAVSHEKLIFLFEVFS
jgi:hypothetical protein